MYLQRDLLVGFLFTTPALDNCKLLHPKASAQRHALAPQLGRGAAWVLQQHASCVYCITAVFLRVWHTEPWLSNQYQLNNHTHSYL